MTKIGMCCLCGAQMGSRLTKIVKSLSGAKIEVCRHCYEDACPDEDFDDVQDEGDEEE